MSKSTRGQTAGRREDKVSDRDLAQELRAVQLSSPSTQEDDDWRRFEDFRTWCLNQTDEDFASPVMEDEERFVMLCGNPGFDVADLSMALDPEAIEAARAYLDVAPWQAAVNAAFAGNSEPFTQMLNLPPEVRAMFARIELVRPTGKPPKRDTLRTSRLFYMVKEVKQYMVVHELDEDDAIAIVSARWAERVGDPPLKGQTDHRVWSHAGKEIRAVLRNKDSAYRRHGWDRR